MYVDVETYIWTEWGLYDDYDINDLVPWGHQWESRTHSKNCRQSRSTPKTTGTPSYHRRVRVMLVMFAISR